MPSPNTYTASDDDSLRNFDILPDSACIRVQTFAALLGVSVPTVWRWSRDGRLPAPKKRAGTTFWTVSEVRKELASPLDSGSEIPSTASATIAALARRVEAANA